MMQLVRMTIFVLIILAAVAIIALALGGFAPLISMAAGILIVYYMALLIGLKFMGGVTNKILVGFFYLLFFIPIIAAIIDFEGLFNFLLQGIHLDMR